MLKIRNPFKNRKKKAIPEKLIGIGELAWKSINIENEPNIGRKVKVV